MEDHPLTPEQVFMIADPVLTLDTLEILGVPETKIDLEARLAVELNRQIINSRQNKDRSEERRVGKEC